MTVPQYLSLLQFIFKYKPVTNFAIDTIHRLNDCFTPPLVKLISS